MSWGLGYDSNWKRDIGYGVPCICDHPGCKEKIDRGLAHVCGGEPYGGDQGCGLYFCGKHLFYSKTDDGPQRCERCCFPEDPENVKPFEPKPDVRRWINWKLTDASWASWRKDNPEFVAEHTRPARVRTGKPKRQRNPHEQSP